MKRQFAQLADGRELIFFDERDDAVRELADPRTVPPPPPPAQLRLDPLTDEWVAIATHRQARTFLPPADECPLCPSTVQRATEIPADDYDVVVFENRFPSFSSRGADPEELITAVHPARPATGRCEVVCFTADHYSSFSQLSEARVRTVVAALADRTATLGEILGVEQVFCFENRGQEIGVTLHHPHGQIYAYPFITPHTHRTLSAARRHHASTGRNLFADVLAAERAAGERIIVENEHWTAFVPAAARWPFEIMVAPHRTVPDLPALTDEESDTLAPIYLDVLRRLDGLFGTAMPYISAWHQAPVRVGRDLLHLYLQLFSIRRAPDKLKYLAGSESAMGVFINDVAPEHAAAMLRDAT
jgi:UDPglucose--hexose-1-phosphate uridylyltransferase